MDHIDSQALKDFFLHDEFARQNGIEIVEIAEGYARTQVRLEPRHLNAGGSVQGGVLFTLADLAFAAATNSHGTLTVTSAANITFVRGASSGIITAQAHEIVNHRHLPFCEVQVTDEADNLLAIFTASGYRKEGVEYGHIGKTMKRAKLLFLALMMTVTMAGQNKNAPVNYDESKVPAFEVPDVMRCEDGQRVESVRQWEKKRRPELLKMFSEQEYGVTPRHTGIKVKYELVASNPEAMDGLATQKQIRFNFTGKNGKTHQALLLLYLPNNTKERVPVIVSYNFHGNQTTTFEEDVIFSPSKELMKSAGSENWGRGEQASRWSYELALKRGYAVATMNYHDIFPDSPELRGYGILPLMPGYKEDSREGKEWGAIGVWAWGYSRIADYLEKEKRIDKDCMVVLGHSRLGKTSLWAGVQDKRFKVVISNDSGCGGAALSKRVIGENLARITANFPHWFCPAFNIYSENEAALPFDQHELLALVAPRHVYVASAEDDQWADPKGEYLSAYYAGPVYRLYDMLGLPSEEQPAIHQPQHYDVGYHIRAGKHDVTEYDWRCYLDFCDKVFSDALAPRRTDKAQSSTTPHHN